MNRELAAIEVVTRLADDVFNGVRVGGKVAQVACWLYVRKVILGWWSRLEHEDAQRRIRCCQSSEDHAAGCPA